MKVFQIGFGRTGTKSLASALGGIGLNVLNLKAKRLNRVRLVRMWANAEIETLMSLAEEYDVVEDHPWPFLYPELKAHHPDAFFIYTTRDSAAWLRSIVNHTLEKRGPSESKKLLFGANTPVGNEALYLEKFEKHRLEVQTFFAGDPQFLQIDLSSPDAEGALRNFLGAPSLTLPFLNQSENKASG